MSGGSLLVAGILLSGVAPTSPDSLSSLQIWLKADAITGVNPSAAITTWTDSSGQGHDQIGAGGNEPTYETAVVNGLPVARYNGTSSQYSTGTAISFTNLSYFVVVDVKDQTTDFLGITSFYPPGGTNDFDHEDGLTFSTTDTDSQLHVLRQGGVAGSHNLSTLVPLSTTMQIFTLTMSLSTTGTGRMYQNGGLMREVGYAQTASVDPLGLVLGARWVGGSAGLFGTIDLAEVVAYNRTLSASERQGVECYLGKKYAIAVAIQCQ